MCIWLPKTSASRENREGSGICRKDYPRWARGPQAVFHDGETRLRSDLAQRAYADLRSTNAKPPPYSPESDPSENIWELRDNRVKQTEPTTRETIKARVAGRVHGCPPK